MRKKTVAITMGEPGGVGPEIIVRALSDPEIRECCSPVVIGNADTMKEAVKLTRLRLKVKTITDVSDADQNSNAVSVLNIKSLVPLRKGHPSKSSGRAVVKYVKKAVECALQDRVHAVVTAPISKESLKMAGYEWPGHTEMLAELTGARDFAMMFVSDQLKLILNTIHIPLKEVPKKITAANVFKTIVCAEKGMNMLGVRNPRIAVAGLNPHAGESGIMGREEADAIAPAVSQARDKGIGVSGPYPPDVVFYKALQRDFDIIVCMYHDQGLIPFKMIAFDTGVNVTVGLPITRTSPDHGTAFDIAWKNKANPASMIEAIKLAAKIKL